MRPIAMRACGLCILASAAVIAGCGDDAWQAPNDAPPSDVGVDAGGFRDTDTRDASRDAAGQTGTVVLIGRPHSGASGAAATDGPGERLNGNAYAITSAQRLIALDYVSAQVLGSRELSGLNDGEVIVAADVRTLDGELYALTSEARVVRVDLETGELHHTAALAAEGEDAAAPVAALRGARFVADWDPLTDRLGLFGEAGDRLNVDADTGMTATAGRAMSPAAYALDRPDATRARIYALDRATRTLFASGKEQPETDALAPIGALDGAGDAELVDLEIATTRAGALAAVAVVRDALSTRLLDVNLASGDLTCPRTLALDPGETVIAFTAVPPRAGQPAH